MEVDGFAVPGMTSGGIGDEDFTPRPSQLIGIGVLALLVVLYVIALIGLIRSDHGHFNLLVLVVPIAAINGLLAYSRLRDFRRIRARMEIERRTLDETKATLKQIDAELQVRVEKERVERAEQKWVDTTARSLSSQYRESITPTKIAEILVEGLGREIKPDVVICCSFAEESWPRIVKQWHQGGDRPIDEALIVSYEPPLSELVDRLWTHKRVNVVNDSQFVSLSRESLRDLLTVTQQRARSWVLAPIAEGSHVIGYVYLAMTDTTRNWRPTEVALVQNVAAEAASACIHARMSRQTMQISETDAMVDRLVELDKVKDVFIENMNHELRSPLTSMIGYMEVIMDDVDPDIDPQLITSLMAVQRNALRLNSLIENMMQLSKAEFARVPLVVASVDIGYLLGDLVRLTKLSADDFGVTVTLRLDSSAGDLLIDGDVNQLEGVFSNLVSNALKFTPRGGTVTISARRLRAHGGSVEVKVTDTGIGIPPDEFPSVFRRFFRASTATQASIPGLGIGLSLVLPAVREHHGTITFDSAVGKGTVFTVTLPARWSSTRPVDETT